MHQALPIWPNVTDERAPCLCLSRLHLQVEFGELSAPGAVCISLPRIRVISLSQETLTFSKVNAKCSVCFFVCYFRWCQSAPFMSQIPDAISIVQSIHSLILFSCLRLKTYFSYTVFLLGVLYSNFCSTVLPLPSYKPTENSQKCTMFQNLHS